jgi:hypothetical protein
VGRLQQQTSGGSARIGADWRFAPPSTIRQTPSGGATSDFYGDAAARQFCRRFNNGQLSGRLVTLPGNVVTARGETISGNPDAVLLAPGSAGFGSVWSMSPSNPASVAFAAIPVSPKVAVHSIIAVEGDGPVETGDDGVVSYQSAHIPEAVSELVVRSGHSMQDNPNAVSEVRRILLLHLAESCAQGCTPESTSGGSTSMVEPGGKSQQSSKMTWHRRWAMAATDRLGYALKVKPIVGRLGRWIGFALLAIGILLIGVWSSVAIWYRCPGGKPVHGLLAGATLIFAFGVPDDTQAMARHCGLCRIFCSIHRVVGDDNSSA